MQSTATNKPRKRLRRLQKKSQQRNDAYGDEDMNESASELQLNKNYSEDGQKDNNKDSNSPQNQQALLGKVQELLSSIESLVQTDQKTLSPELLADIYEKYSKFLEAQRSESNHPLVGSKKLKKRSKKGKRKTEAEGDAESSTHNENIDPNTANDKKRRLDKLAQKLAEDADSGEKERSARKRIIENYAMGIEDDDDDFAPNPKDVADELDNDSLYWKEESDSDGSGYEQGDKKKRKSKGANKKNCIKVNNKLFGNIYDDEDSENGIHVSAANLEELDLGESKPKKNPTDFRFAKKMLQPKKTAEAVVLSNIWNRVNKNILAEKGYQMKIQVEDILKEIKAVVSVEAKQLTALEIPDIDYEDHEIEFVDPERLRKEQLEKEEREKDPEEKAKAPVIMGNNSLSLNKRTMFLESLRRKKMGTVKFEELEALKRVTDLKSKPKKSSQEEIDPEAAKLEAEKNLKEVNAYINNEEEAEGEDSEYVVDDKKIRELEGDLTEEESEEEEVVGDQEAVGEDQEAEGEDQEAEGEGQEDEGEVDQSEAEETKQPEMQAPQIDPKKQAEELEKLARRIKERRRAAKFLETEAELGSDHEDNDGVMKDINKHDLEEILDKKLEFMDGDLEDLIDNDQIDEAVDHLASKFLEDDIVRDRQDLVKLIATITSGKRRNRSSVITEGLENEPDNVIWARMRQKQNEMLEREERDFETIEEAKKRIIQECEDEKLDEEETRAILDEKMRRQIRQTIKKFNESKEITKGEYDKVLYDEIVKEKIAVVSKSKQVKKIWNSKYQRKSIAEQLFGNTKNKR